MTEAAQDLLFDLTLSDEQRMNRDTMQRFAAQEMRDLAPAVDLGGADVGSFLPRSAELGLTLLPIPEALGGAGMQRSPVSNALIHEDLAHGDLGLALGAVAPLGFVNTLLDQGTDAQKEALLPRFCSGEFLAATTALQEPRATFEPTEPRATATPSGEGFVLNGSKCMVPLGMEAELVLVIAQLQDTGPAAFIVQGTPEGMQRSAEENMGLKGAQLATLQFDEVQVPADALLGGGAFNLQRFLDLSRIGICALAVGACQAVLDYVVPYCNEREAFGEPISNRQSVAFMIADIAIELESMRLMTWRAAALAERGEDFHEQAYLAKQFCAEYAMKIGTDGVQLLGGHGYTREHPVELWYRHLRAIDTLEGVAAA
ncbi:MAG: oxidoreductase [Halioglobus sp.]|nr:oxidoreductase [Halioglobus sp.]|tara:strand:+ start:225 stop:1340 length:1116 start_codon:yes stop_codon:yes gene_type:complete